MLLLFSFIPPSNKGQFIVGAAPVLSMQGVQLQELQHPQHCDYAESEAGHQAPTAEQEQSGLPSSLHPTGGVWGV